MPILSPVQTPGDLPPGPAARPGPLARSGALPFMGERLAWVSGLVLTLSAFMDWYAGRDNGPGAITISVIGWHTGLLGKLVFVIGLIVLLLLIGREFGIELPPTVPEPLVMIALGSLATIFVLIRLISIPDEFLPASGRGIGIYIALVAALGVIASGLVRAAEEL
jgi:hypothetical protein